MDQLNKGDYANGDPIEVVYNTSSRTFRYEARSALVNEDLSETIGGRKVLPIPKLKRKMMVKVRADEWPWGDVEHEIELPKRVWAGRNSGVMFRVIFLEGGEVSSGGFPEHGFQ